MTRLYGYKWTSKEGELDPRSYGFRLWCEKTEEIPRDDWIRGFDRCESDLRHSAKVGDECWPPSYAEFVGFCDAPKKPKYFFNGGLLPEPPELKEARMERGRAHMDKLKGIFDE